MPRAKKPTNQPARITNKSRNVGSRKPGRPPKNKPQDKAPIVPASDWTAPTDSSGIDWGAEFDKGVQSTKLSSGNATNQAVLEGASEQPIAYTGISQVAHGLSFQTFDPNKYFPTDLMTDSSSLEGIDKADADVAVHSIERKRQRMRIVLANQGLMQDIIRGGMENRKIEGLAIDFDKLRIDNETKFIGWQTAGLNRDIAANKWMQTREKLIQGQKTLAGLQSLTPLIDEEWSARKQLKLSSIADLKTKALRGSSAMDAKLSATIDTIASSESDD